MADLENPFAGQGPVMLDIGGDVGALVVTMPLDMEGVEIEIRPDGEEAGNISGADHDHGPDTDDHDHDHDHAHPHVGVVNRPAGGENIPSLVYPELVAGDYVLVPKGGGDPYLRATVVGGEVTTMDWATRGDSL